MIGKKTEPKFSIGQMVRCLVPIGPLEVGEAYTVISRFYDKAPLVAVENKAGLVCGWFEQGIFAHALDPHWMRLLSAEDKEKFLAKQSKQGKQKSRAATVAADNVNHPKHYTAGKIEVIEYIEDQLSPEELQGYFVGNIIKYLSRHKHKGGIEDLKKARWYLDRMIKNKV